MTHLVLLLDAGSCGSSPGIDRLQALDKEIMRSCVRNLYINYFTGEVAAPTANNTAVRACLL